MALKIDTDIPMPEKTSGETGLTADLRELLAAPVGASAFFELPEGTKIERFSKRMSTAVAKVGRGWATHERRLENGISGIRVWKKGEVQGSVVVSIKPPEESSSE